MSANSQSRAFEDRHLLAAALRVPSFEEALARLLYVVEHRRPCGLVLGLAGTGKSILLKALVEELTGSVLARTSCRPQLLDLRAAGSMNLAWALAAELGLSPNDTAPSERLWRLIEDRFQGAAMSGQSVVPVFDHLEPSDPHALRALSRCCQLAVRYDSTVIMSARPRLSPALADVVGPLCDLRIELPLWTHDETALFVTGLLNGSHSPLLVEDAVDAIHACSCGRMRDTLQVLRLAIFAARAQGLDRIDAELVRTVAGEIWQPATQLHSISAHLPPAAALAAAHD